MRQATEPLFHIARQADWVNAGDTYVPSSFDDDGFIHCATRSQVLRIANERFGGRCDLIVLVIDPRRVPAEIRLENLEGGSELFPHIYGPLERSAVVAVETFSPGSDGTFELPNIAVSESSDAGYTDRCVRTVSNGSL
jgi:uncharacterized protein (DUF952 family)